MQITAGLAQPFSADIANPARVNSCVDLGDYRNNMHDSQNQYIPLNPAKKSAKQSLPIFYVRMYKKLLGLSKLISR